ncbi:MAG: hypothetical protein LH473_04560 [Chitinophagales bacterium]|nr:hypothetical protein [Chitinophagales bacterium]
MKTKIKLLSTFTLMAINYLFAQDPSCNGIIQTSSLTSCPNQSVSYLNKYSLQSFYVPNENTPVKVINVNLHIMQREVPAPRGNFDETNTGQVQFLTDLFNGTGGINYLFSHLPAPSDPVTCVCVNACHIIDSRIQFSLNGIYYHQDNSNYILDPCDAGYTNITYGINTQSEINIYFYGEQDATLNGCATTPSTNLAYIQWIGIDDAIYTYPQGFGALVTELSHELGHNLGLLHTYAPTCCPESCTTTSTDFLSDVFGSGSVDCPEVCSQDYGWSCDIYSSSNSCSNNLMGGTNTSGYLSPLQLGRIHRETQLKSLRKYMSCELGSIDWKITTDEVWDFDIKMYDNIIVNPGASLTASCNITLPCNGKIDIKPGGRLILSDNSSITMATGSFIHVEEGATLEINNTVSGKGIIFDQSGTNYVKVEGTLQFGANADFTIQGIGYYHF